MSEDLPPISLLIPTFNEAGFIEDCVRSLVDGKYPTELIEVIIIDGNSKDDTRSIVNLMCENNDKIRLLDNPKQIVPAAMNIGIDAASNDIIVWAGAHAIYDVNYLVYSVTTLLDEKCSSVGGVITPKAKTNIGNAIALATSSKFGIGNAKYRHAIQKQHVDTVFAGCWRKEDVLKIGGFNEEMVRNQDYEFNCRLRANIGDIILDPRIKCQYFCRESIPSLAKQYFSYGYWRFNTFKQHPSSFTIRQAAPVALFTGLLTSLVLTIFNTKLGLAFPLFYITATLIASIWVSISNNMLRYVAILPVIFVTLHLAWATGFIKNAFSTLKQKILR